MIKTIVGIVVALLAAFLIFAATKPDTFRVERAATIKAPPEKIFALISDLHGWGAWSPWEKMDPAMKRTYSGAASGKGAVYEWDSNGQPGAGRMEITDASPPSKVAINLDFVKPFEAHNVAQFTLDAQGDSTNVKWAMSGPSPYIAKIMDTIFNMDKTIGKEFATGLSNLKAVAEK